MKRILSICIMLMVAVILQAQTVAPTVDTLWIKTSSGPLMTCISHWGVNSAYTPGTTCDTLAPQMKSRIVEVVHAGGYTGDTLWVGFQQSPATAVQYTVKLVFKGDTFYYDFGGAYISRLFIKASGASVPTHVRTIAY